MKRMALSVWLVGAISVTPGCAATEKGPVPDLPQKVVQAASFHDRFREQVYANPASRFFRQDYSLTTLAFSAEAEKATIPRFTPFGKGEQHWGFNARSHYLMEENHRVWGEAAFHKGQRKEVRWSETSDYELLYPYIMADEFGGDLDYEQYDLDGGYAGRRGKWVFGAEMGYRARCEYRTKDPRPNNTVADLQAQLGIGYVVGQYELALSASAGKYKQTNELKYFNELGASKEYHLTGLGTEYYRFSGACNNVFYRGHHFGGSLEFLPTGPHGISVSLQFDRFEFDKVLNDLNRLSLNHVNENKLNSEITWTAPVQKNGAYGIKLNGIYSKREGYDNLFGDATGNVYPQIGETLMFKSRQSGGRLSAFFEQTIHHHYNWGISPFVGFYDIKSSHEESGNHFNTKQSIFGGTVQGSYTRKRHFVQFHVEGDFRKGSDTQLQLDAEMVCHPDLKQKYTNFAAYLNDHEVHGRVNLHYEFKLRPSTLSYFVEASYERYQYLGGTQHNNCYFLTTGIKL